MLTPDSRLQPNLMECASKVIDGEAVIINLSNGTYYSLDQVGALVWELIGDGWTLGEIGEAVAARYDVTAERAAADAGRLVAELVAEKLLVAAGGDAPAESAVRAPAPETRLPYAEPALTTYRDMADLLALDPPLPRLEDVVWSEPDAQARQPIA